MNRFPVFHFSGGLIAALIFVVLLLFVFVFLPVSLVTDAFGRLGMTPIQGFTVLLALLLGRSIDIPVYTSERLVMVARQQTIHFTGGSMGQRLEVETEPANELRRQVFAVNLGGCILPVLLSFTFVARLHMTQGGVPFQESAPWIAFAVAVVGVACYALSRPDAMVGIRIPMIVPALVTFVTVAVLVPHGIAPVAAYVAGTLGTIIGGCVAPLLTPRLRNAIAAPVVSVGGSGTFAGIFLAGIISVLLS